uniref:Uncharacterized protein n=1 Tax=Parascaris univalens TaxID=6257 RepID=A0A915BDU8_PARUN
AIDSLVRCILFLSPVENISLRVQFILNLISKNPLQRMTGESRCLSIKFVHLALKSEVLFKRTSSDFRIVNECFCFFVDALPPPFVYRIDRTSMRTLQRR